MRGTDTVIAGRPPAAPRRLSLRRLWRGLRSLLAEDVRLLVYRHDLDGSWPEEPARFRRNHVPDVLRHRPGEAWYDSLRFQRDAWANLADGEWLYTCASEQGLLAWFWVVPEQGEARLRAVRQCYAFPPGSYVSYGAYVMPEARGLGLFSAGKRQLLRELQATPGARHAYCAIKAENCASRAVSEKLGYRLEAVLRYRRILFWSRAWRESDAGGL